MDEIYQNKNYQELLLNILNNQPNSIDEELQKQLKFNIYLSLLSLNNYNYQEEFYTKEHNIIDDILRKINNLKVKIQLKRKTIEIDNLIEEIINIYHDNLSIINKYNKSNLDFIKIINSKDPKEITNLIDKLTKVKIKKNNLKAEYDLKREIISKNIFHSDYIIQDNNLYLKTSDKEEIIPLEEFYEIFDYLLNINNYQQIFLESNPNDQHKIIIEKLIDLVNTSDNFQRITPKEIIPIILTYLFTKDLSNLMNINTSNFKIDNIKITDLYSFASNNKQDKLEKLAKCNKITIPNEYLYQKIKDIIQKGMYYYDTNTFILENIDNKTSDFKISIDLDKIITFINEIIDQKIKSYPN